MNPDLAVALGLVVTLGLGLLGGHLGSRSAFMNEAKVLNDMLRARAEDAEGQVEGLRGQVASLRRALADCMEGKT